MIHASVHVALVLSLLPTGSTPAVSDPNSCHVVVRGKLVELRSPSFVFVLDASAGLAGVSWENRLTGRRIPLGNGPEVELEVGTLKEPRPVRLRVVGLPSVQAGRARAEAVFKLAGDKPPLSVVVTYRLDAAQPVLRKFVAVTNAGDRRELLLNARLGSYLTGVEATRADQGFPVYLGGEFFVSLAHPSGQAVGGGKRVILRQYPGAKLAPGGTLRCMEAVYGVGARGAARATFLAHVRGRMRRVLRGHDKAVAIFEPFGARPGGNFHETEAFLLDNLAKLGAAQRESGHRFDYYSIDFWQDVRGDLIRFDPKRFPHGFGRIKSALGKLGIRPGLWIDSGGLPQWTIGSNPRIKPAMTGPDGGGIICRAAEPARSLYTKAFVHHIKVNGVRLLKFDNLGPGCRNPVCNNPKHDHLPGIYSLEAIHNAVIEFLGELDRACPDVFLMLYWGYRSPWWLLHADTYFDSGEHIEAASPTAFPAPHARDSVTQRLDQAQWVCRDTPALGKDSLGVWLSDWPWNSCIGKERWQEGFVMDMGRGSLLGQIWSDTEWLSPPERRQIAEFLALLKARPACFGNSRFILGDPWRAECYGYCCTDGKRGFLAIHNACWQDRTVRLKLNSAWGLPAGSRWDVYRWWPDPARLRPARAANFGQTASIALRPFQVVLLEVAPAGSKATLGRSFAAVPIPTRFAEPTTVVELVEPPRPATKPAHPPGVSWTALRPSAAVSQGGARLTVGKGHAILADGKCPSRDTYVVTAETSLTGMTAIQLEALCDAHLPCGGPGRAENGNFILAELSVSAAPGGKPKRAVGVAFRGARADVSQRSHGGWPIEAAIDGNANTGWSIDPDEGSPHVAVFETSRPVGFAGGTTLTIRLRQGLRGHSLGRFRLSVTTARPPVPLPAGFGGSKSRKLTARLPATAGGGLLVVAGGKRLVVSGAHLAGRPVAVRQVWHVGAMYPSSWQAWRLAVPPADRPRMVELVVTAGSARRGARPWTAYFLPK